jgi:hypothetical protein
MPGHANIDAGGTSYLSSPDTPSSVFPDRLIRPLPKRSLKSRLSQDAVEAIEYPPSLPSTSLPTYTHYSENGEYLNDSKVLVQNGDLYDENDHYHDHDHDHDHNHDHDHCPHHHHCHHDDDDDELDSADDSSPVALRRAGSYRSSPRSPRSNRHARYGSQPKNSISAPDGYEAFENTNNKKKRKIPTSGSLSLHHSSLTSDLAQLGISGNKDGAGDDRYAGSSTSGLGVQGAGRGHFARRGGPRRPLGVSMNGSNLKSGNSKYDRNMSATAKGTVEVSIFWIRGTDCSQLKILKIKGSSPLPLPTPLLSFVGHWGKARKMVGSWTSKRNKHLPIRSLRLRARPMPKGSHFLSKVFIALATLSGTAI